MDLKTVELAGIKIYTADQLDGYGLMNVSDAISNFKKMLGNKVAKTAMEWCCGPGYFGLMSYKYGIAENVVLSDIFEPLGEIVNKTISENNLNEHVRFIHSNNFKNINEKFDLIIGNPPHFNFHLDENEETLHYNEHRKFIDLDWKIHEDFFDNVNNYLNDAGSIILMENVKGSTPKTFLEMIEKNNLKIKNVFKSVEFPDDVWYMEIVKRKI